mmetsp:Transcript_21365/g.43358  ORF Transcript_21365/g.43358 Transcript_21365/m.43358 type:complete len:208 (-) Transcript_21365:129-752(-)
MAQRLRLTALSLLLVSSSTHGRTLHNRRQLRQPLESRDEERLEDSSAGKVVRSDDRGSNKNHGFYDLSSMTFDEKIRMIKTAYKVNKYSDSIDWDGEFEKFREAVRESRRSADERDSAEEVMDEDEEEEEEGDSSDGTSEQDKDGEEPDGDYFMECVRNCTRKRWVRRLMDQCIEDCHSQNHLDGGEGFDVGSDESTAGTTATKKLI